MCAEMPILHEHLQKMLKNPQTGPATYYALRVYAALIANHEVEVFINQLLIEAEKDKAYWRYEPGSPYHPDIFPQISPDGEFAVLSALLPGIMLTRQDFTPVKGGAPVREDVFDTEKGMQRETAPPNEMRVVEQVPHEDVILPQNTE